MGNALVTGVSRRAGIGRCTAVGRWGEPDDAARLVAWLCSDDGRWITGQVIDSEGGFRRST
jgi:3-oxoacyl-[acyl-carrier protein] reductase